MSFVKTPVRSTMQLIFQHYFSRETEMASIISDTNVHPTTQNVTPPFQKTNKQISVYRVCMTYAHANTAYQVLLNDAVFYEHTFHHHHHPLTARVGGAPQMISQPVSSTFPVLHCPLRLGELQACPFPDVVFQPLRLSALSPSPFHGTLQDGFGQS